MASCPHNINGPAGSPAGAVIIGATPTRIAIFALACLPACTQFTEEEGPRPCKGPACHEETGTPTDSGNADSGNADSGNADSGTPQDPPERALVINEFVADNLLSTQDETGNAPDWIEIHNPGDAAISLAGCTITDDLMEPEKHVLDDALVVEAGGYLLLWADGEPDLGPRHLDIGLEKDGEALGLFGGDGWPIDTLTFGQQETDMAAARVPDASETWAYVYMGTPGASNNIMVEEEISFVPKGATWSFRDTGTFPGSGWKNADFDDADWPEGPAPLGYGDAHQLTTLNYGDDSNNKHITSWFRASFTLDDPSSVVSATLALLRDDGAVIYLNGTEVRRDAMPDGAVGPDTYATETASGTTETSYFSSDLPLDALVAGTNILAAEVHQASASSSDLGFDLELIGTIVSEKTQ